MSRRSSPRKPGRPGKTAEVLRAFEAGRREAFKELALRLPSAIIGLTRAQIESGELARWTASAIVEIRTVGSEVHVEDELTALALAVRIDVARQVSALLSAAGAVATVRAAEPPVG